MVDTVKIRLRSGDAEIELEGHEPMLTNSWSGGGRSKEHRTPLTSSLRAHLKEPVDARPLDVAVPINPLTKLRDQRV
ncbi:hypothetical protein [Bradyrhizobium cosmicum]|uniref:hypothetical protein n=1 Tax=Bradyrhizobium cosmicum TaxID=1404864 RepID=UPI00116325D4|nr:hypothetical protein [Bradyrhizobium cosmicum]QDP23945.1 hypothetical protein FNV92_18090 [Bradyrhizobium cosmicum]